MRRIPILTLLALALFATVAPAKVRQPEVRQVEDLRVKLGAEFSPHALPRHRLAPIRVEVVGAISTTDGSHPPPLRWLEVALNRHGRISTAGLPTCSERQLQSTTSAEAFSRCGSALVGHGTIRAAVASGGGEDIPATGTVLAFNSVRAGKPMLLLHLFASVPVRLTLVVPLTIGHLREGQFGTVLRAHIPKLGGDIASVTEIDLELGRSYSFHGRRRSYLSAACSAPPEFDGGPFSFLRGSFRFEAHPQPIQASLIKTCRVR